MRKSASTVTVTRELPKSLARAIFFGLGLTFLVFSVSACALLKPPPDDTKGVRNWLVVPVFFATNRRFDGSRGGVDFAEALNANGLTFGVKNVAVPVPIYSPVDHDSEKRMLWLRIEKEDVNKEGTPDFDRAKCPIKDSTIERDQIVARFKAYMKATGSKETVIFVHGCCATFDTSLKRAARLSAHMQAPVLAYDWISPRGFTKYLENETLARQSLDDFCRFLGQAEKILGPGNISLLGHSMGALFIDEAMVRRSAQNIISLNPPGRFAELIMSNADLDARTFLNHASQFDANAARSRIYISTADSRLNASAIAHGGFKRLGEPGPLTEDLAKTSGHELIDITANNSGHELPFWIVANLHRFGNLGSVKEYQLQPAGQNLDRLVLTGTPSKEAEKASADCHEQ